MRVHINPETGEPGICKATISCPFGDLETDHYPSKEEARAAYSEKVEEILKRIETTELAYDLIKKETARLSRKKSSLIKKINKKPSKASIAELEKVEIEFKNSVDETRHLAYMKRFASKEAIRMNLIEPNVYDDSDSSGEYPSSKLSFDDEANDKFVIKELTAWTSELTENDAKKELEKYDPNSGMTRDEYVVSLFQKYSDSPRKMVFIDIETSGFSPTTGEIIEVGIVVVDEDGNVTETIDQRYDLEDSNARRILGTGPVHIHGIKREDLEGKPSFKDHEVQEKLKNILNNRNVALCAHNDSFERRWLNHYLEDFDKTHDKNNSSNISNENNFVAPCQDTMNISKMLLHSSSNNRLEGFAEANGIPYEDSHSAFPDAMMTAKAYINFRKSLKESPLGIRPNLVDRKLISNV